MSDTVELNRVDAEDILYHLSHLVSAIREKDDPKIATEAGPIATYAKLIEQRAKERMGIP